MMGGINATKLNVLRTDKESQQKEEIRKAFEAVKDIHDSMVESGFEENFIAKVIANILKGTE